MTNIEFDWFYYINLYYSYGIYTKEDVATFVPAYITTDQYQQITGEAYQA